MLFYYYVSTATQLNICKIHKYIYIGIRKVQSIVVESGKHVIDTDENREHNCNHIIHHLRNTEYNFA